MSGTGEVVGLTALVLALGGTGEEADWVLARLRLQVIPLKPSDVMAQVTEALNAVRGRKGPTGD